MSNLHKHALMEFKAAKWLDDNGKYCDDMQEAICAHVLKLLEVFSAEEHSGSSAPYAVDLFKKLAMFEPVVPLTGEDWEWTEVRDGMFQNKRCSHVFKQADRFDGQAYDSNGIIFYDWYTDEEGNKSKSYFTGADSRVPVTFPYIPVREYKERVE
ncbi:MAG: hypothetical protein EBQ97_05985 [Bacteroidetes bacterium]|nr:hypothetical protein [Bacteroidota bacterium]